MPFREALDHLKNMYRIPSDKIIAQKELEDAKRHLLAAEAALEDAEEQVKKYAARVNRLYRYVVSQG